MRRSLRGRLSLLAVAVLFLLGSAQAQAQGDEMPIYQALTQTKEWLNTSRPLTPDDLKGRILLVDFWTYCCINCIHVIPKLHALEKEFGDKLTVIGVHSAKFTNEGETENIREAIQKYEIEHPVINDADFRVWNSFGANAWPTLALIAPNGLLKNVYRGEGDLDEMRKDIRDLIAKNGDALVTGKLPLALEKDKIPSTVLRFPTKMSWLDKNTLVISDSGHHRIVVADIKARKITTVIGSGAQGFADGDFQKAQFNAPQGVLADGNTVYVADTGNHRLRKIDLVAKTVETIAGTGERGNYVLFGSANALKTALASPWDLAFYPNSNHILIANAGTHQLWSYDLANKTLSIEAGNGRENIDDGRLPFNSLSQPSGISVWDDKAYFVDSETSSLRVFDGDDVETLIGTGLFDFGLKDGDRNHALMQHAIGLTAAKGGIYIADTYNHAIRRFKDGQLTTLPIKGLKEPNAIIPYEDGFLIADTNNHRIVAMDQSGKMTDVIDLMPPEMPLVFQTQLPNPLPLVEHSVGTSATVQLELPKGWHLNPLAPSYLALFDENQQFVSVFKTADLKKNVATFTGLANGKTYTVQGILYYCEDKEGSQCLIRGAQAKLTVQEKADSMKPVTFLLPQ